MCAGPTPPSTSGRATSDARIEGPGTTSPPPPRERRPLRDPWSQGIPADPASCRRHLAVCLPPGRPRGTFSQRKPRHRPNFRPDRFQPAAARRRAAAPWRPVARRAVPPRPTRPSPFPSRPVARMCAAARPGGRAPAAPRPGRARPPGAFAWVPGIFTRSLNCKLVRPQPRGFGTRCPVFQDFETGTSHLAFPKRLLPSVGAESQRGPPRARAPPRGFPDAGWGATCGLGRPDSGAPGCLHFTPPAPGCFHVTVLERLS